MTTLLLRFRQFGILPRAHHQRSCDGVDDGRWSVFNECMKFRRKNEAFDNRGMVSKCRFDDVAFQRKLVTWREYLLVHGSAEDTDERVLASPMMRVSSEMPRMRSDHLVHSC